MIRFRLRCAREHDFEAWFRNGADFDAQSAASGIVCPICGDNRIGKAPMAPRVARRDRDTPGVDAAIPAAAPIADATTAAQPEIAALFRKLRAAVAAHAEYVGPRFAEEARRIHDDEADRRGIYGEATPTEIRSLIEDGIDVLPLPRLPEEHN